MDFKTLGENSPVYIIRKKPFQFEMGVLKSKGGMQQQNPYMPQNMAQTIDVTVSVGGSDEVVPGIPLNTDVVEYRNTFYSVSSEGAQRAVANLMQMAHNGLAEKDYYESVLAEGEKAMETLNPQYAEGKKQARTIKDLQDRQNAQDKKLDLILSKVEELFQKPKV